MVMIDNIMMISIGGDGDGDCGDNLGDYCDAEREGEDNQGIDIGDGDCEDVNDEDDEDFYNDGNDVDGVGEDVDHYDNANSCEDDDDHNDEDYVDVDVDSGGDVNDCEDVGDIDSDGNDLDV